MKNIFLLICLLSIGVTNNVFAQRNCQSMPLQKVVTAYFNLKNALVQDDSVKAKSASASLCAAIDTVNIYDLTVAHKKAWTKLSSRLSYDAEKIESATSLAEQRKYFKPLSVIMYKLTGKLNINTVKLYYQYCETANAYWVSAEAAINNPYLGKNTSDCGYTKAVLNAHK